MPIIPGLGRGRQESGKLGVRLGCTIPPCLQKRKQEEDIFLLGLHSPSALSQSFSFPSHQTGRCVGPTAQIPPEPGLPPRLEEATNTLSDRDHHRPLPLTACIPPNSIVVPTALGVTICPLFSLRWFLHPHPSLCHKQKILDRLGSEQVHHELGMSMAEHCYSPSTWQISAEGQPGLPSRFHDS